MNIISPKQRVSVTHYFRVFCYADGSGSAYSFNCDEQGNPDFSRLNPEGKQEYSPISEQNYNQCLTGTIDGKDVVDEGIQSLGYNYNQDAIGICDRCEHEVVLSDSWLNTCEHCHADYDGSGNLLASRSQWGEESGEHWTDLINIPSNVLDENYDY
jgi:hypothetical protein